MKNLWLAMAPTLRQDGLFHGKSQQHLRVFMNGTPKLSSIHRWDFPLLFRGSPKWRINWGTPMTYGKPHKLHHALGM